VTDSTNAVETALRLAHPQPGDAATWQAAHDRQVAAKEALVVLLAEKDAEIAKLTADLDRATAAIIVAHAHVVDGTLADDILNGYWEGEDHSQTVDDYIADGRIQPDPWRWADRQDGGQ
jgi:hypothetical protein